MITNQKIIAASSPLEDLKRLCIHTITTRPWSIEQSAEHYSKAGVAGISVWRQWLEGHDISAAGDRIRNAGLEIVSLVRGGYFPSPDPEYRERAVQDNLKAVREAAELGAPLIVLVCGADPKVRLEEARGQIEKGIEAILPAAEKEGIKLSIEPLHPMYADSRSAINTMKQANDLCQSFQSPFLGVTVDVYHTWWDPDLKAEIERCGSHGWIFSYHVCDWLTPTEDLLNDRGLMGDGCIPLRTIRSWVESAGFTGPIEVEIFSDKWWAADQHIFLKKIIDSYLNFV